MPPSSFSFSWDSERVRAGPAGDLQPPAEDLRARLRDVAFDRGANARAIVDETTAIVLAWVLERPASWSWEAAAAELEAGLLEWDLEQGWRGPCAVWLDALRRAWHAGIEARPAAEFAGPTGWLAEELGLWIWGREGGLEHLAEFAAAWRGDPLGPGRRVPSREALAAHAASELADGELVLVAGGHSETVLFALQAAWRAGRRPEVWIAEGAPDLGGRRMARELTRAGLREVELGFDAAAHEVLPRADRVWLGTEAIGAEAFLARVGTRALLEAAERLEVPVEVLATSDKLVPGGVLRLPVWASRDTWMLWDAPPEGVRLQSQFYETVALDHVDRWRTEEGLESPAALHLRALRVEAAEPCGGADGCGDARDSISPTPPTGLARSAEEARPSSAVFRDPAPARQDHADPREPVRSRPATGDARGPARAHPTTDDAREPARARPTTDDARWAARDRPDTESLIP